MEMEVAMRGLPRSGETFADATFQPVLYRSGQTLAPIWGAAGRNKARDSGFLLPTAALGCPQLQDLSKKPLRAAEAKAAAALSMMANPTPSSAQVALV
jgi:hypothetical protein